MAKPGKQTVAADVLAFWPIVGEPCRPGQGQTTYAGMGQTASGDASASRIHLASQQAKLHFVRGAGLLWVILEAGTLEVLDGVGLTATGATLLQLA